MPSGIKVIDLKSLMAKLPAPSADAQWPDWDHWRYELYRHVIQGEDPSDLMTWPCIQHNSLVNHLNMEMQFIELQPNLDRWEKAIRMQDIDLHIDKHDSTAYSKNLICQCGHVDQWEKFADRKIEKLDSILEFGAGYGAMALVANRLGFQGGYVIYDLPEFCLLQRWYLEKQGIKNIRWFHDMRELKKYRGEYDLLIAMWSLTEAPIELRQQFLQNIYIRNFLLAYSLQFAGIDNVAWINGFMQDHSNLKWHVIKDEYINNGADRYAIGW